MKTLILALAIGGALASAAPAMAQSYYGTSYSTIQAREDRLSERIDQGLSDGVLSLSQAGRLRNDLKRIQRLDQSYRWDGLTLADRLELSAELSGLEASLRYSMAQSTDRDLDYGYGYYR